MKKTLIFSAVAVLIFACGSSQDESSSSSAGQEAQAVAATDQPDGKELYKTYCVTCHGLYGDMGASGAYNLQESKLSLEERIAVVTNGRKAMTAFESLLDKDEIKAVSKYTMKLSEE